MKGTLDITFAFTEQVMDTWLTDILNTIMKEADKVSWDVFSKLENYVTEEFYKVTGIRGQLSYSGSKLSLIWDRRNQK
jgi:hypothetical protein